MMGYASGVRTMANVPITKFAGNVPFDANVSTGVAKLIGFRLRAFGGGEAVVELESGPQHYNPMGTIHGGVLCDIADAAMGAAFATSCARCGSPCCRPRRV